MQPFFIAVATFSESLERSSRRTASVNLHLDAQVMADCMGKFRYLADKEMECGVQIFLGVGFQIKTCSETGVQYMLDAIFQIQKVLETVVQFFGIPFFKLMFLETSVHSLLEIGF